jgi:hypothetical protein
MTDRVTKCALVNSTFHRACASPAAFRVLDIHRYSCTTNCVDTNLHRYSYKTSYIDADAALGQFILPRLAGRTCQVERLSIPTCSDQNWQRLVLGCPRVQRLVVQYVRDGDLLFMVKALPLLQNLTIHSFQVESGEWTEAMPHCRSLTSLTANKLHAPYPLGDIGMHCPALRAFEGHVSKRVLQSMATGCPSLTSISGQYVEERGVQTIAKMAGSQWVELKLSSLNDSDIAQSIAMNCRALTTLKLTNATLDSGVIQAMMIGCGRTLTWLDLSGTHLTDEQFVALVPHCPVLQYVEINDNPLLTCAGVFGALPLLKHLRGIHVNYGPFLCSESLIRLDLHCPALSTICIRLRSIFVNCPLFFIRRWNNGLPWLNICSTT